MSERQRLDFGSVGDLQELGAFGRPVHTLYPQLRAVVAARLSQAHADIFAEPVRHDQDNRIDWYSPVSGEGARLDATSPEQATAAQARLAELSTELDALSKTMQASANESDQALGQLIALALQTADANRIFLVGDQPVVTFWGFNRRSGVAASTPLHGIGSVAAAPAPVAAAAAPVAVARAGFDWRWLMWLAALLIFLLAAALLLKAAFGVDVPGLAWLDGPSEEGPVVAGNGGAGNGPATPPSGSNGAGPPPADNTPLLVAQERERELLVELASLDQRYQDALAACPLPLQPLPPRADPPPRPDIVAPDPPDVATIDRDPEIVTRPGGIDIDRIDRPDRPVDVEPDIDPDIDTAANDLDDPTVPPDEDAATDQEPEGDPLVVDAEDREAMDIAALQGDWHTGRALMDQGNGNDLVIEYDFGPDGSGRSRLNLEDGTICEADVDAAFLSPDMIVIQERDHPQCSDGTEFERSEVVCMIGDDGIASCTGQQAGGGEYPVPLFSR